MTEIRIVEVGLRDGLQNESRTLALEDKLTLIHLLEGAGLTELEIASFVRPDRVPQMADSAELMTRLKRSSHVRYSALVPNIQGMQQAVEARMDQVAVFTSASEGFCRNNINCSIEESYRRFELLIAQAQEHRIPVRGYLSCIHTCPYDGRTPISSVIEGCQRLFELGCFEVSLGDTLGTCTPFEAKTLLARLGQEFGTDRLALHFHNTYGQALANLYIGLELGFHIIDSSIAGLGGCPYAKGASGNVATEDVVYMLEQSGMSAGVDLERLLDASVFISQRLRRPPQSALGKIHWQER